MITEYKKMLTVWVVLEELVVVQTGKLMKLAIMVMLARVLHVSMVKCSIAIEKQGFGVGEKLHAKVFFY